MRTVQIKLNEVFEQKITDVAKKVIVDTFLSFFICK